MKKRLSKRGLAFMSMLIAVLFILIIWTAWSNTALMVNAVVISSSCIPTAFSGFRIAQKKPPLWGYSPHKRRSAVSAG